MLKRLIILFSLLILVNSKQSFTAEDRHVDRVIKSEMTGLFETCLPALIGCIFCKTKALFADNSKNENSFMNAQDCYNLGFDTSRSILINTFFVDVTRRIFKGLLSCLFNSDSKYLQIPAYIGSIITVASARLFFSKDKEQESIVGGEYIKNLKDKIYYETFFYSTVSYVTSYFSSYILRVAWYLYKKYNPSSLKKKKGFI